MSSGDGSGVLGCESLYWKWGESAQVDPLGMLRQWAEEWAGSAPLFWLEPRLQWLPEVAQPLLSATLVRDTLPADLPALAEARLFVPAAGMHLLADVSGRGCRWSRYWVGPPPEGITGWVEERVSVPPKYSVVLRKDMQRFALTTLDDEGYLVQEYWRDGALVAWNLTSGKR